MKHLLHLALACSFALSLVAQDVPEQPQAGYLNIVNLITLRSPTHIDLGGFELNGGDPVAAGGTSGILAIIPGSYRFTVSNEGAKPERVSGSFSMEHGKTVAIICFDEVKESSDGEGEAKLRFTLLTESDTESGPRLSLVSLVKEPIVGVEISGTSVSLMEKQAHRHPVSLKDEIKIAHKGGLLAELEIAKPIHYIGFLFEDPETGEVGISLIENEKLEYHPPLETDDEDEAE